MKFVGQLPEIGQKIRVHHPWLEDGMVGIVTRHELIEPAKRFTGMGDEMYDRYRIHLKDVIHCDGSEIGETYYDNLSCTWESVDE